MAAGAAQTCLRVEILASRAAFFAVSGGACSRTSCHTRTSSYGRTLAALLLARLGLVTAASARNARLVGAIVEGADGAWHTIGYHYNLASGAGIFGAQFQRSRVGHGVRQNLLYGKLVIL